MAFSNNGRLSSLCSRPDCDINIATYYGTTALTNAIRCGNDEAVEYLLMRRDLDVNYQVKQNRFNVSDVGFIILYAICNSYENELTIIVYKL